MTKPDLNMLQIFTVGAIFGWIAFAIAISLLPGGGFQDTVSRYGNILAAYVALAGGALAYRAAMSRLDHDRRDVEMRRATLARSLNGEYEARLAMLAGRITYVGVQLKARGLTRDNLNFCRDQLVPARERLSALLIRNWESLHEASDEEIEKLIRRAIRGEAILRNLSTVLQETDQRLSKPSYQSSERDTRFLCQILANTLDRAKMIDPKMKEIITQRIDETRGEIADRHTADLSVFDKIPANFESSAL